MGEKTVAFYTLGCKVNQSESASLARLFEAAGYRVVEWGRTAGVYVINTCTVTHLGDRKSRQAVRRAVRANPSAVVVVTGCYAEVAPEEVSKLSGVDLVMGTGERHKMVELVEEVERKRDQPRVVRAEINLSFGELPPPAAFFRTRAFLKVQEGCNRFCTYCIVPLARGPQRSLTPEKVLAQAVELVEHGYREIVVTGINTGAYGRDLAGHVSLAGLLRALAGVEGLARIRVSSVEPEEVTDDLIQTLAKEEKICRHLHLPLQSGDDAVLKAMGRHYTSGEYRLLVRHLKNAVPGLAVTADVIAGFPGEMEQQFLHTCTLVLEEKLAGLHVFKFSPRRGTVACSLPGQVSPREKEERGQKLIAIGRELERSFRSGLIGRTVPVLVEGPAGRGLYTGLTDSYVRVYFPAGKEKTGKLLPVLVEDFYGQDLLGKLLEN